MVFMYEGGLPMWITLGLFLIALGACVVRRSSDGWSLAALGGLACLASGLAGFATGLYNTVAASGGVAAAQRAEVLAVGLRESVHNLLFAAALAAGLALIALITRRGAPAARPA